MSLFIVINPRDCPRVFLFRYIWFYCEYFYRIFYLIRYNTKKLTFGRFFEYIRKNIAVIIHTPKMIMFDYHNTFKSKFDEYDKYCSS